MERLIDIINNIVFYKKSNTNEKCAKIFFRDKSVKDVSFDEAIDICLDIAKELNLKNISEFKKLLNNKMFYTTTEKDLIDNISFYQNDSCDLISELTDDEVDEEIIDSDNLVAEDSEQEENDNYDVDSDNDFAEDEEFVDIGDPDFNVTYEPTKKSSKLSNTNNNKKNDSEKKGFFGRIVDKIKNNKIVKRIILCVTALAVGLGIYSCASRKTLEGKMANSNLASISDTNKGNNQNNEDLLLIGDNSYYDNYSYDTLQKVNTNEKQKNIMKNTFDMLKAFNGDFANAYVEKGNNIKPALSFEEVMALQTAYNVFSKDEIKAIFNGADIKSKDLENNYKSASLQLMGAYVIETKEHPIDASLLEKIFLLLTKLEQKVFLMLIVMTQLRLINYLLRQ